MGNAVQIERLAQWLTRVRDRHPDLCILVDPVIGDVLLIATAPAAQRLQLKQIRGDPLRQRQQVLTIGVRDLGLERAVTTGYMGNAVQIERLAQWLTRVRDRHPDLCMIRGDPLRQRQQVLTIGVRDLGLDVDAAVDIANHTLSGRRCRNQQEAVAAARSLLSDRLKWVVITSALLPAPGPKATRSPAQRKTDRRYPSSPSPPAGEPPPLPRRGVTN
jgi:pyridoxal/pyridoxine/pyridoxamine kinase